MLSSTIILKGIIAILSSLVMSRAADENSERLARWKARWEENKIGWHEDNVHEAILKYGETLLGQFGDERDSSCSKPRRVLFPLCGKTNDMAHVAHFESVKEVVGVDGIRKALDEFSAEHPALEIRPMGSDGIYDRFSGKKVTLLKGDFFELDETTTGGRFDVIFDRASMVAIEPSLREQYVKTMSKLIAPGGKLLLVVIERRSGTEEDLTGPPFSIPETEVRRLYEGQQWVGSVTLLQDNGEQEQNKGSSMASLFFLIQASDVSIL